MAAAFFAKGLLALSFLFGFAGFIRADFVVGLAPFHPSYLAPNAAGELFVLLALRFLVGGDRVEFVVVVHGSRGVEKCFSG